jgi:hypothetical protein
MGPDSDSAPFSLAYLNENRGPLVQGVAIVFIVLEIGVVIMRLASRRLIKTPLALDDYLVFPALVFCLALCALAIGKFCVFQLVLKC